jgi:leader peptidase (prepilin peptidase)/N-methyltransferase
VTASETALLVFAVLAGACVGSFTNVVIARLPRELAEPNEFDEVWDTHPWREVLGGESHCAGCGRRLGVLDLVPVVSWIALRGKCRSCGARIPAYHPLVEALVPALGVLAWVVMGWGWELGLVLWLVPVGVAIAAIDFRTLMVPTRLVWPAFAVTVVLSIAAALQRGDWKLLSCAIIGVLVLAGPLAVIWFAMPAGMGFGDVRLAVLAGWTIGFQAGGVIGDAAILALGTLLVACVVGIVIGLGLMGARGLRAKVPFGPAILISCYTLCLVAPDFLDAFHR